FQTQGIATRLETDLFDSGIVSRFDLKPCLTVGKINPHHFGVQAFLGSLDFCEMRCTLLLLGAFAGDDLLWVQAFALHIAPCLIGPFATFTFNSPDKVVLKDGPGIGSIRKLADRAEHLASG